MLHIRLVAGGMRAPTALHVLVTHGEKRERIGQSAPHTHPYDEMGKKKPSLKSNVQRGFATTSVPKREQPAPKEAEAKPAPAPEPAPKPPTAAEAPASEPEAEPVSEETSELQKLVDLINPKVEKEAPRKLKVCTRRTDPGHRVQPAAREISAYVRAIPSHS